MDNLVIRVLEGFLREILSSSSRTIVQLETLLGIRLECCDHTLSRPKASGLYAVPSEKGSSANLREVVCLVQSFIELWVGSSALH